MRLSGIISKIALSKIKKCLPALLTILASVGVVATGYFASEGGKKSVNASDARESIKNYIPAIVTGGSTIACLVTAYILDNNRRSGITGAYILLDQAYKEYKCKVKEVVGDKKEQEINDLILMDKWAEPVKETCISPFLFSENDLDGHELYLFYEENYGKYFKATKERVISAEYHMNRNLMIQGQITLNEFYEFLGLPTILQGDDFGWGDEFFEGGFCWIDAENRKVELETGLECYIISFDYGPYLL